MTGPPIAVDIELTTTGAKATPKTALIAVDEWLAVQPNYYANLLIKARLLWHQKNFAESEQYFLRALEAGKGLNSLGVDITCTSFDLI